VIRKTRVAGKTLPENKNVQSGFASTWDELAIALGRTRRCLQKWREKYPDHPKPRADGRHSIEAWRKLMLDHNLADEPEAEDDGQPKKSHWDRERSRVEFERAQFSLEIEKHKHVELDDICAAVGQMLAGFRTAINMLPGSAARWLIGLKDFHAIKDKLQSEVESVLQALGRCKYLEDLAPAVVDRLLKEKDKKYRADVLRIVRATCVELGRESFKELQLPI
jgi:hypothetical protein